MSKTKANYLGALCMEYGIIPYGQSLRRSRFVYDNERRVPTVFIETAQAVISQSFGYRVIDYRVCAGLFQRNEIK